MGALSSPVLRFPNYWIHNATCKVLSARGLRWYYVPFGDMNLGWFYYAASSFQNCHVDSGIRMTGVSKTSLFIFVVFARFLAFTAKVWQVNDHRKRKEMTMNQSKTSLFRSGNLKGLVFLSPDGYSHKMEFFLLRAPKIAIANRRDFLSQTSPSPAKPQWGRIFPRKIAKRIAIASDFPSRGTITRLSGAGGHFWGQTIAAIFSPASKDRNRNRRQIATTQILRRRVESGQIYW